jgi:hypothetical protein
MAALYGKTPIRVISSMVDSITVTNTTITSQGNDGYANSYKIEFYHPGGGCGPSNSFLILFKETNPVWKYITWEWIGTGTASCWNFNHSVSDGNLLTYNSGGTNGDKNSLNDAVFNSVRSWNISQYQAHGNRTVACDNEPTNFLHLQYHSGNPKSFFMKRRRNMNGSLSGIFHNRNCTSSVGTSIIQNIVLYI